MVCTSGLYQRFLPADPLCQAPQIQSQCPEQDDRVVEYASRDMLLPDIALVNGRVMVAAWEFGLDTIEDDVIHLMMIAIETQLKTLLAAIVSRQQAYRLHENRFRHSFGTQVPPAQTRRSLFDCEEDVPPTTLSCQGLQVPSMKPSFEVAQRNCAVRLACAGPTAPTRHVATLYDLLEALQVHKSCLPSHTVYTLNIQRILYHLWHPSHEDVAAEEKSRRWKHQAADPQLPVVK